MVKATFEHEGNSGLLHVTTHFGRDTYIVCEKLDGETFKLGGTAINDVAVYEGVVLRLPEPPFTLCSFRAFRSPERSFEGQGLLSLEEWTPVDRHCYVTEYYDLDMEEKVHGWFLSKSPIEDANHLFVNLDVCDGGGNVIKRYRVSPFTGAYVVREGY